RDRKAGGILIENIFQGNEWRFAVIGIGININQTKFPENLGNPVSLKQITGKSFDVLELANGLCGALNQRWELLQSGKSAILHQYEELLYRRNEKIRFRRDNKVFEAIVRGVQADGKLCVNHGVDLVFDFGEVEWII